MITQRSHSYEAIKHTVEKLKVVSKIKDNLMNISIDEIKKAQDENLILKAEDTSTYNEFNNSVEAEVDLCKSLHNQVDALVKDYSGGRLNYARFIDYLRPVKNFLNANQEFQPTHFKRNKVEQVVNKYL